MMLSYVSVSVFQQQFYCINCPMLRHRSGMSVNDLHASCMCFVTFCTCTNVSCKQIINPPSLVPRSCGRREKWPGIHYACMGNYPVVLRGTPFYTVVNKLLTFSAILTFASLVFLLSERCLPRTMFCKKDDKEATSSSLIRIIHMFIRCIKALRHVNGVLLKFTIPLKKVLKQMVVLAAMVVLTQNMSHRKQSPTL